ncbi:MAG: cytochrome c oxidase accessory protein CcoG [Candidatus Eisenbacteria bacterium]|uniref:Cytochrome c oxidase accessory protein CcoG n=1 Tax=Eiseniibacteriota bacterium TaxID=2212470 RepID=A0A7Y2EEJ1_UNCEI|nr:cytochrome c oxidase accessory protein CcoG [Candidatus Eisenbacteria bacterium]
MAQTQPRKRTEIRWPEKDTVYTINPDGSRNFLHPADVKGRWQIRKNVFWTILIGVYLLLPLITIKGAPAVHIDIPGRAATLFGFTFTNQDFYLTFFVVSAIGFSLFVATSLYGRVWCGFACPQTVFLEGVFRRIERWIEGSRAKRIRRNMGPWNFDKAWRKILKHAAFLGLSALIAHAFVAYFIPAKELGMAVFQSPSNHWAAFLWTLFWTGMLYFNYSWFREQTCLIICPYGRLQSALIDQDTKVIGYDDSRGEPRSKVNDDGGDCIDCHRCVQVCPTGVDIRNGLQMECVGCFNCIDACDDIMDKLGRPRGLIRYDSGRAFATGVRRKLLRPRFYLYVVLAILGLVVATTMMSRRTDFEAKVLRARGMPYQIEGEELRNLWTLRVQNKTRAEKTFFVSVAGDKGAPEDTRFVVAQEKLRAGPMSQAETPVFSYVTRDTYEEPFPIAFTVVDSASGTTKVVNFKFLGP